MTCRFLSGLWGTPVQLLSACSFSQSATDNKVILVTIRYDVILRLNVLLEKSNTMIRVMKIHDNLLHPLHLNVFLAFSKHPQMNSLGYCLILPVRKVMGKKAQILSKIIHLANNSVEAGPQDFWTLSQFFSRYVWSGWRWGWKRVLTGWPQVFSGSAGHYRHCLNWAGAFPAR